MQPTITQGKMNKKLDQEKVLGREGFITTGGLGRLPEEGTCEPVRCVNFDKERKVTSSTLSFTPGKLLSQLCLPQTYHPRPQSFKQTPPPSLAHPTLSQNHLLFPTCIIVNYAYALFLLLTHEVFEGMKCVHVIFASLSIKPRTGPSLASNMCLECVDK